MCPYRLSVFLALIFLLVQNSYAQLKNVNEPFTHYTKKDGLASNTIYCTTQDLDGRIWFGTDNGVSIFDGHSFKILNRSSGLPSNEVFDVFCDSQNRLWFVTATPNLSYYYQGRVYSSTNDSVLKKETFRNRVSKIFEDSQQRVWVVTDSFNCHIFGPNEVINIDFSSRYGILCKISQSNRTTLFMTNYGTFRLESNQSLVPISVEEFTNYSKDVALIQDKLICVAYDGKFRISSFKNYNGPQVGMKALNNSLFEVSDSTFAIVRSKLSGLSIVPFAKPHEEEVFLKNKNIASFFKDRYGKFWIPTLGDGVYLLSNPELAASRSINKDLFGTVVCTYTDLDHIYLGTTKGFFCLYDKANGDLRFAQYEKSKGRLRSIKKSVTGGLLLVYDQAVGLLKDNKYKKLDIDFADAAYKDVEQFRQKNFILSSSGVFICDSNFKLIKKVGEQLRVYKMLSFQETIYLGTSNGLRILREDHLENVSNDPITCQIVDIASDGKHIFIGTIEQGLFKATPSAGRMLTFEKCSQISSSRINQLDLRGDTLEVSTDKGYYELDRMGNVVQKLSKVNGTLSTEIIGHGEDDWNIYLISKPGVVKLAKNKIKQYGQHRFHIDMVTAGKDSLSEWSEIKIRNRTELKVYYSVISNLLEGDLTYAYRIQDLDSNWKQASAEFMAFERLPFGKHVIEFRADVDGDDKTNIASITVRVEPFLWQTLAFKITLSLIFLVGTFTLASHFLIKERNAQLRRKENEITLNTLQLQNWRNRFNPHFIFNSINSIVFFFKSGKPDDGIQFVEAYSDILRYTIDQSNNLLNEINDELLYLKKYFELERVKKGFDATLVLDTRNPQNLTPVFIPTFLLQIVVENAIKHGIRNMEKGMVTVCTDISDTQVVCQISNNGAGLGKKETCKTKEGLNLIQDKIALLNKLLSADIRYTIKNVYNQNHNVVGVCNTFIFPLIRDEKI